MIVNNVSVYGLKNSIRVSKFPMMADATAATDETAERQTKLAQAPQGSGHDNFLKGIIVQLDLTFTIKAWTQIERYHFLDIVSSQSTMHRIAKMDFKSSLCEYVTNSTRRELERLREAYNAEKSEDNYLRLLYNCPVGLKLTAGITTNYQQLKTIYAQRRRHKLPEWREFCNWIETLPYSEWITSK